MGFFRSFFGHKIICPHCSEEIEVKSAKEMGQIELLGKDMEGYIHLLHKGQCGAHIIWNTLSGKAELGENS